MSSGLHRSAHLVLTRLLAIVETVKVGNPFVMANAVRLKTIAWAILGLEMMHFTVGAIVQGYLRPPRPSTSAQASP